MTLKIIISINEALEQKLCDLFRGSDARRILEYGETFPYKIEATTLKPIFPSDAKIEYLEKFKGRKMPDLGFYRIYIGDDIDKINEVRYGVELPSKVLDDENLFRREILHRIRRIVGSPRDN